MSDTVKCEDTVNVGLHVLFLHRPGTTHYSAHWPGAILHCRQPFYWVTRHLRYPVNRPHYPQIQTFETSPNRSKHQYVKNSSSWITGTVRYKDKAIAWTKASDQPITQVSVPWFQIQRLTPSTCTHYLFRDPVTMQFFISRFAGTRSTLFGTAVLHNT